MRKEIRKLRSELREKKALLDEKTEQFDSANSMFDRVIERERLYRRELDMHYERDMEEKSRNINCLLHSQDKNQKRVIELEEMYTLQKRQNEMLCGGIGEVEINFSKSKA